MCFLKKKKNKKQSKTLKIIYVDVPFFGKPRLPFLAVATTICLQNLHNGPWVNIDLSNPLANEVSMKVWLQVWNMYKGRY